MYWKDDWDDSLILPQDKWISINWSSVFGKDEYFKRLLDLVIILAKDANNINTVIIIDSFIV